jgi:four helix bundle protein
VHGFRGLEVYRRVAALADQLYAEAVTWPLFERRTIGEQLVRAADSVGANLAEADGRYGPADQRRILFIARGSALELQHWLERASARRLPIPTAAMKEATEVGRMLNGLIRKLPRHER